MAAIVPDEGELAIAQKYIDAVNAATDLELRLYQNDYTPVAGSELADFTEANFDGYAAEDCDWNEAPTQDSNDDAQCTSDDDKTFAHDGGMFANSIYGWYMVDTTIGAVVLAERFSDAPRNMEFDTDEIVLNPIIKFKNCE